MDKVGWFVLALVAAAIAIAAYGVIAYPEVITMDSNIYLF